MSEQEYDPEDDGEWDYTFDEEQDCTRCGGEGWVECTDRIQCTRPHNQFGEHRCKACKGSGDGKDQTVW